MQPTGPANILVVDDQPNNRIALTAILSSPDYRVVEASSGREALRRLLDEEFAVVLLDVVMPVMNGFELAAAIKQREKTAALPIVFLTAEATDLNLIYKGYQVGAVDYLTKPLVPEIVRAKVAVFAELYRQNQRIEQQAALLVEAERNEHERRLIELQLTSERRYRSLAEAVPHIVWTARPDGSVDYLNQRWSEYTGVSVARAAGSWAGAVHPDEATRVTAEWQNALHTEQMFQVECRLHRAYDDTYRWHLCRAMPERGPTGQVIAWLGTFTDIDDQKRAQAVLVDAVRARDNFLCVASHELRNPLTALQLHIEMLVNNPKAMRDPEHVNRKLEVAARQVERMSRLLAELMDVSRITTGHLRLEREQLDLATVLQDVVSRSAAEATRAGCVIELKAPAPVVGNWDPLRVEQVATNLLTNAFKFASGKPIELAVEQRGPVGRLIIRDHGIGIAPDDVGRIFDRYEQANPSRAHGGLGLGLYIVRQIVEAHGGTIRVESQPGHGSTFTVELPREPEPGN